MDRERARSPVSPDKVPRRSLSRKVFRHQIARPAPGVATCSTRSFFSVTFVAPHRHPSIRSSQRRVWFSRLDLAYPARVGADSDMMNGDNGAVAKPTPPPTLPKSYTPSAAAAYRLASMERLAQRQRIFEQGGPPPNAADDQPSSPVVATSTTGPPPPPPVTAPKPVLGTKASIVVLGHTPLYTFSTALNLMCAGARVCDR